MHGHRKIAGPNENGYGVEESYSSNPVLLFDLDEEFCSALSSSPRRAGGKGDSGLSSLPQLGVRASGKTRLTFDSELPLKPVTRNNKEGLLL